MSPASDHTPPHEGSAPLPKDAQATDTEDSTASPWAHRLRWSVIAVLVIGYAALSHYSASSPNAKGLGAALSLGPVLVIGVIFAWRWTNPGTALLIAACLGAFAYRYWAVVEENYEWGDLAQQCGAYGLVAASFARSLFGGRVPLCTQLASTMHGALSPAEISYTHRATVAWMVFYALLTTAILALFFVASQRIWSLFVNFATFGLIILMGIADHAIRLRVLPRHPGGGILGIIKRSLIG
ncbi:MAG: hypothetical protein ABSG18_12190 [Steroidobacteraceae bacterium]